MTLLVFVQDNNYAGANGAAIFPYAPRDIVGGALTASGHFGRQTGAALYAGIPSPRQSS